MATKRLSYDEIIEQARSTWTGKTGDERADSVKRVLDSRLENYSQNTGIEKNLILDALERRRDVNTVNFYQENRLPLFDSEKVYIFESMKDFQIRFPSGKYQCPSCGGQSTDPYSCTVKPC